MLENWWMAVVSGKKRKFIDTAAFFFLLILSAVYGFGLMCRRMFYKTGIIKPARFNTKVIAVGNISMGGTGKTPFVEALAKRLLKKEKKLLIVAKGYKRKKLHNVDVVSEGYKPLLDAAHSGDEPYMLARNLQKASIVVGSNKIKALRYGIERFKPDAVLLDDGFQKRYVLDASANVVLINALNPFGYGYLFPAGLLREGVSSLAEADAVVITNVNLMSDTARLDRIKSIVHKYNNTVKIFEANHVPEKVYNIKTGEKHVPSFLRNKKVIAFSSIGNPAGFERTLKKIGAHIVFGFYYKDHHAFTKKETEGIASLCGKTNASFAVTTEKDEVRINGKFFENTTVYALRIGMVIPEIKELEEALEA